jgi:hypothetical protein
MIAISGIITDRVLVLGENVIADTNAAGPPRYCWPDGELRPCPKVQAKTGPRPLAARA